MLSQKFTLSEQTRILTPDVRGLEAVLQALREGRSLLASPDALTPVRVLSEAEQWLYCQSSGSTGFAKTIRRTPGSWIASFEQDRQAFGHGPSDTYAALGSLSHSLALFAVVAACHMGADVAVLSGLRPRAQLLALQSHAVTVLYATPAQLRLLVRAGQGATLPSLRWIFSSGGKLDQDVADALGLLCPGAQLREIFGATETSYITLSDAQTPAGSVGRAYPGVELRIAEADADGVGEIWLRSGFLFDGYSQGNSPDTRWDGDWLSIGEMGWLDDSGNLFPKGRRNRMVTVADKNVFPEEIEQILMTEGRAQLAAVVAVADPLRGHHIIAAVQGNSQDEVLLRQLCRDRIGAHAVPRHFHFLAQLPLLPAGKPDLQRLRALLGAQ